MRFGILVAYLLASASAAAAPAEMHGRSLLSTWKDGQPGHEPITAKLKGELARLTQSLGDADPFAAEELPNGDGHVTKLRGKWRAR